MGRGTKRRSRGSTAGVPTSKRRKRTEWTDSMFGRSVESAGLLLSDGSESNQLSVEPAIFQKKLATFFRRQPNLDEAVEEFSGGLTRYTEDAVRFRVALLPSSIAEGADVMTRSTGLDSLLRQLLSVDCIQPAVVHMLLLRLSDYMDSTSISSIGTKEFYQVPSLILNQLRWLDHIVNGKDLCKKLLEVVGVAPVEIQREVITAIPEILDDAQHDDAAMALKSMLQTHSGLVAAIIDTLSSLNLTADIVAEVLDVAMGCLASAAVTDLPTILKFITEQVSPKNAVEIITEVRDKLDFDSAFIAHPAASSTPRATQRLSLRVSSEASNQFMVFDTIRSSIRFKKPVADGWMKSIEAVSEGADHKVVDLFVLFILHSLPSRKKAIENLFITKVRTHLFTEELLAAAFGPHAKALTEFFPNILSLSEALLGSSSPTVSVFTTSLFHHLFSTFDVYCRQEIIGTLVTHIGSGEPAEVDRALDILATLVDSRRLEMERFAVLIKGVLDYLEHLTVGQIRRLYSILSVLAFHDPEGGSSVQDEMHTLIRKQLSHVDTKYRRMGVIGAVMIIRQLAMKGTSMDVSLRPSASQGLSQHDSTLPPARRRQAISMLDDIIRSCSNSPDSIILFCDEMASAIQSVSLDSAVLRHLCDETTSTFQEVFLIEVTDALPTDLGLPLEFTLGLDSTEEGSIAVNLFPLAVQLNEKTQERGAALRGMASQFRLLRICEQTLNGSLEGVDALLGAPVVLCCGDRLKTEVFEDLPLAKRQAVCLSLCHCLNWFRELVCAFAGETDVDMRGKVLIRLKNITEMQTQLESCLAVSGLLSSDCQDYGSEPLSLADCSPSPATPGFLPPQVTPEEAAVTVKTRRGKRLGSKGDSTVANVSTTANQTVDKDSTSVDKTASVPGVSIDQYRQCFRELDLTAFGALRYDPVSRTILDTDMHTREKEVLSIQPQQLSFLLHDLSHKLSDSLSLFGARGLGRPKAKGHCGSTGGGKIQLYTVEQLVTTVAGLMSSLCEHLENTSGFFQAQLEENDGIVDMRCSHGDHPVHCSNLDLLLKSMATFFAWSLLPDPHYSEQLYMSLKALASRTGQTDTELSVSISQLAKMCHTYLEQFSQSLPSLPSAHGLVKLMVAISKASTSSHLHSPIASTCQSLLQRKWVVVGTNQQRSDALEYLLRYHIEWSPDPLEVLENIAGEGITELLGEDTSEESTTYPTLSNNTLPCYYRALISGLVGQMKAIPAPTKGSLPTVEEQLERFHALEVSTQILHILVNIVKSFDRHSVLSSALKYGRRYVEAFIKSGMPILHNLFRSRKDDVMDVLKTLQKSTRLLQHFCGHSKVAKDISLTKHVPPCKRSLEMLVFRVKELLTANNCAEAFWLGNLKNRDIQGQEILSQASQMNSTHREEEDGGEEPQDDGSSTTTTTTDRREEIMDSDTEHED